MGRRATALTSFALLSFLSFLALADIAQAGGLYLSEFGTSTLGTASAGAAAGTDAASTALHNPAGMTRLTEHQFSTGLAPAYAITEFDADSDTPLSGSNGGNQGGFVPIVSSQYVHKLSDRWRLGLSLISFSGTVLDPSDGWVGRQEITQASLFTLTLLPVIAYRVTDWLSIGPRIRESAKGQQY